jgi:hypothetical protein
MRITISPFQSLAPVTRAVQINVSPGQILTKGTHVPTAMGRAIPHERRSVNPSSVRLQPGRIHAAAPIRKSSAIGTRVTK